MTEHRGIRLRTLSIFIGLAVAALLFGVMAVLESGVVTPRLIALVNSRLEPETGLRLSTSSVYLRPWSGLTLHDVRITLVDPPATRTANGNGTNGAGTKAPAAAGEKSGPETEVAPAFGRPAASRYVLSVGEVAAGYRFFGLFGSPPRLERVHLRHPDLDLNELGEWLERLPEIRAGIPPGETPFGMRIDSFSLVDGLVRRDRESVISSLRLEARVDGDGGRWRLALDEGAAHIRTSFVEEDVELTGLVDLEDGVARLDGLHLGIAGGRVSFRGELAREGSSILVSGYSVPLAKLASWGGMEHRTLSGELEFRLLATGRADSLVVQGGLRGVADDGTERRIRVAASRLREELSLQSLDVRSGDSRLEISGLFQLGNPARMEGVAVFRELDLASLLGEPDLARLRSLDGTVRFEGSGLSRDTFRGSVLMNMAGGELFGLGIDSADLLAFVADGGVELREAELTRGESSVRGSGTIDAANRVDARFTGTIADLGDLGALARISEPLEGQATATIRLEGPIRAPSLDAGFHFDDARLFGASARDLDLTLEADALTDGSEFRIGAAGQGVGYGDREIPLAFANGTWRSGIVSVTELRLESDDRGELRVRGDLDLTGEGNLAGRLTGIELITPGDGGTWTNAQPVQISRNAEALTFDGLDIRNGTARVTGDVAVRRTGEARIRANGVRMDLEAFSPFLLTPRPLVGILDFDVQADVGQDTLAADVRFDLSDGAYGNDVVDRAEGVLRIRDDGVTLEDVVFRSALATAAARGVIGLRSGSLLAAARDSTLRAGLADDIDFRDLHFRFDAPDADRFHEVFPWFPTPGGRILFTADVAGSTVAPPMDLHLVIEEGRVGTERLDRLEARGRFERGTVMVDSARIGSGSGEVFAEGRIPVAWSLLDLTPRLREGGEMDLRFQGTDVPAGALAIFTPLFEMGEGPIRAVGRLTGIVDDRLWLEGDFSASGGKLTIPEFQDPLIDGTVRGRFTRDGITFEDIRFADGAGGTVTGKGVVRLPNLKFTGMNIRLEGTNYHYRSPRGVFGVGDGWVRLTEKARSDGKLIGNFQGEFDVARAEIDDRLFLEAQAAAELVPEMPAGVQLPEEARIAPGVAAELPAEKPTELFAEIGLHADKNVWIRTEIMEVEVAGDVTFHITEDYLGLTGEARSLRGRYAVLNTDFDVDRAEVRFVDPSNMFNSVLDAEASCRVLDEEVTFEVTGTTGLPIVVGRTESDMSEAEIYELLALRQKRTQDEAPDTEAGVVSNAFLESWGALLATRFGRNIGREVGLDTFELDLDGGSPNVGVGKYLGSDVFVRYRERLGTGVDPTLQVESLETPERQLLLEYRLSEIFQLQGETGFIQDDPYLNVDLKAEWGY